MTLFAISFTTSFQRFSACKKSFAPFVVQAWGYAFATTYSGDAVFTFEAFQYDPDFFFRIEFAVGLAFDLSDNRFWVLTGFRLHLFLLSEFMIITQIRLYLMP
jgi:hypothetical protein